MKVYNFALSEEKYFYFVIQKRCKKNGIKISKGQISNIVRNKGKNRQAVMLTGKRFPNKYPKRKRTSENISKIRALVLKEIPATQRSIAKSIKISVSTVNKIINTDLNLKTTKKMHAHLYT